MQVAVDDGKVAPGARGKQPARPNIWRGTVESVEPDYGRQIQLIYFQSGDHLLVGQADIRARIARGEQILAKLDSSELHFFKDESGERII